MIQLRLPAACAVAALTCATFLGGGGPAAAAEPLGRGTYAGAAWFEKDVADRLGRPGNTYDIRFSAEENFLGRNVGGGISIYDCDPGEIVGGPAPRPGQCAPLGFTTFRDTGDVVWSVDGRTGTARISGTVEEVGPRGGVLRRLPVSLTVTGDRRTPANVKFGFDDDAGTSYVLTGWLEAWVGQQVSGRIGPFTTGPGAAGEGDFLQSSTLGRYSIKSYTVGGGGS